MSDSVGGSAAVLEHAYDVLSLSDGHLVGVDETPSNGAVAEWVTLAARVGAERIFFVEDDPVVVFSVLQPGAGELEVLEAYRLTWCLARPRCLFLAVGDELRVYSLSQPPNRSGAASLRALQVVRRASEVADVLAAYRRERLESGTAFEGDDFGQTKGRADERLLGDVRIAESALMKAGLSRQGAHALIERAILVRYLEDRGVLTRKYFEGVAAARAGWQTLLSSFEEPAVGAASRFVTCLGDKALTAAVFQRLATDFNGDLFVDRHGDLAELTDGQLQVLADLLRGAEDGAQGHLFFWAYDFSVVPIGLISSMYELFYRRETDQKTGTYYTPRALVEFVLASVLTDEVLSEHPVVCDPACGSGVFLVEAFRRIARYEADRRGTPLTSLQLQRLLLKRVRGVDVDGAAIRLAAFSLYLAFLDLQSPPDILKAGPLPRLIADDHTSRDQPLRVADAFAEDVLPDGCFDVVVANPPWTEPKRGAKSCAAEWADVHGLPYGDKNPSQLFVWRSLKLLRSTGTAALLIAAGALLNARSTSQTFRRRWLSEACVEQVTAFWPVRSDFFSGARAPFSYVRFRHRDGDVSESLVVFDTARRGGPRDGSLTFLPMRRRLIHQDELAEHDFLWKTMSEGGRRDMELVLRLRRLGTFEQLVDDVHPPRYGWQKRHGREKGHLAVEALHGLWSIRKLESWGPLLEEWLVRPPERVTRVPHEGAFRGQRLLVDMGVTGDERLHARLAEEPFAFDHNIWALPLAHRAKWEAQVALGILLSSTGRYFLAMTSGHWGVWRDQMRKGQLLQLPMPLASATDAPVRRILAAVEKLSEAAPAGLSLFDQPSIDVGPLLERIDLAVFDLLGLADFERDLVEDHWRERDSQRTAQPGLTALASPQLEAALDRYTQTFVESWRPLLGERLDLGWNAHRDRLTRSLAVVFELRRPGISSPGVVDEESWAEALGQFAGGINEIAKGVRSFGMLRVVTDREIVVVKSDRPELWTATAAREDAEATSVQATVTPAV